MLNSEQPRMRRRLAEKPRPLPSRDEVASLLRGDEPQDTAGDGAPPMQVSFQGVLPTVPLKRETSSFAALTRQEKLSLLLQGGRHSAKEQETEARQTQNPTNEIALAAPRPSRKRTARGVSGKTSAPAEPLVPLEASAGAAFPPGQLEAAFSLGEPFSDDEEAEDDEEEEKELNSSDSEPFSYSTAVSAPAAAPAPAKPGRPTAEIGATRRAGGATAHQTRGKSSQRQRYGAAGPRGRGGSRGRGAPKPSSSGPPPVAASVPRPGVPSCSASLPSQPLPPAAPPSSTVLSAEQATGVKKKKHKAKKETRSRKSSTDSKKKSTKSSQSSSTNGRRERLTKDDGIEPSELRDEAINEAEFAPVGATRRVKKDSKTASQTLSAASQKLSAPFKALKKLSPRMASHSAPPMALDDCGGSDERLLMRQSSFADAEIQSEDDNGVPRCNKEAPPRRGGKRERDKTENISKTEAKSGQRRDKATKKDAKSRAERKKRTESKKETKSLEGDFSVAKGQQESSLFGKESSLDGDELAPEILAPPAEPSSMAASPYGYSMSYDLGECMDEQRLSSSELHIGVSPPPPEPNLVASGYDLQKLQGGPPDFEVVDGDSTTEGDDDEEGDWAGYNYIQASKITNSLAVEESDGDCFGVSEELQNAESGMNWNNLFQDARHQLNDLPSDAELDVKIAAHKRMAHLTANFEYTAATFGKVIIAERTLPNHAKSIPPFNCGGRVGGEKFLVHGVLFKFAIDVNHILGSDESAMKIAGHELKALNSMVSLGEGIQDLHYPMMALIDYRGYRLIALSQLPISDVTLALGSSDAGRTVYHSDALLLERTTQACQLLNLKAHHVGHRYANASVPGPVDLEGHVGIDGRRYLLDFARLFPPDVPSKEYYCGYLYRLLRPELVKAWSTPLCSDAFSKFVSQYPAEALEHKEEVKAAAGYMTGTVIPEFASILSRTGSSQFKHSSFVDGLHRQGVNLRYLGLVRQHIGKESEWSDYLLVEMVARAFKWRLRAALREAEDDGLDLPSDVPHRLAAVDSLNEIFSSPCPKQEDIPDPIWSDWLPRELEHRFPGGLFEDELSTHGALRRHFFHRDFPPQDSVGRPHLLCRLFDRLDRMLDVTFTPSAKARFSSDPNAFLDDAAHWAPFDFIHIANFSPMVKHLSLMEFTMGKLLLMRAKKLDTFNPEEECSDSQRSLNPSSGGGDDGDGGGDGGDGDAHGSSEKGGAKSGHQSQQRGLLMQLSLESFERALECNPSCITTLLLCAGTYAQLGNLQMAKIYYQLAKNVDETNPLALYKYARFLHEHTAEDEEAEDLYLAAIRHSESQQPKPLMYYAKFLATKGDNKEAAHSLFSLAEDVASEKLKPRIERIRQEAH